MYGYVVVNKPELKFKEFDLYRSYYCGLCDVLKNQYGFKGQLSLSYDMTFLVMLLSGLYEPQTDYLEKRCVAHPVMKHQVRKNAVTEYVAHMDILMTYYKCMDDWKDEHKVTRKAMATGLSKSAKKIALKYPKKAENIKNMLSLLSNAEEQNETDIDLVAGYFGRVMAEMMCMKEDEWKNDLYAFGMQLGKFIYLVDAYEDLEGDCKAGRFNVLKAYKERSDFDAFCEGILNAIMAEGARQFERLPIVQDVEILRNIIYSGVWTRFQLVRSKKLSKQEKRN
jgi:hypothetical protein